VIFAALLVTGLTLFVFLTIRSWILSAGVLLAGTALVVILFLVNPQLYQGLIVRVLEWFSLLERYNDFSRGILSISPIVYYISFSSAFIFLTVRVIEKRRWQ